MKGGGKGEETMKLIFKRRRGQKAAIGGDKKQKNRDTDDGLDEICVSPHYSERS